ncbi:MAG: hypothetical protein JXB20_02115 [Bacilli bacterium]|nr:hypothetical protein [Bacilli bacterium]MBN2696169.1 hypothetical protein [Bacilli bacterium]
MNELSEKYWVAVKYLFIPYLALLFILVFPLDFLLYSPGGLTEVDKLIEIEYREDKQVEGTISTTFVMSVPRPTIFQFLVGYFNEYADINVLPVSYEDYTNEEIAQISYQDKDISVSASIIVAYETMQAIDPAITVSYEEKTIVFGKSNYLSNYDQIHFGDAFIQMVGEGGVIATSIAEVGAITVDGNTYDFTFERENGDIYTVPITKNSETGLFGMNFKVYREVDPATSYPIFSERNTNVGGSSGGLLQTLAIYNMLSETDITHGLKIAGTGTIDYAGNVGNIGAVKQKVLTAYENKVDVFFMSPDDYNTAVNVCEAYGIDHSAWLVSVATFQEALDHLESLGDA